MSNETTEQISPAIDVFPSSPIAPVSQYIFSGFLEHLGRCIYGGILPSTRTTFPHTPRKPCPEAEFNETPQELLTPEGFRADVLEVLRDELRVPLIRWPGGNFVSSYNWKDGIGPREERKRRPELAWNGEESNQFGTDEQVPLTVSSDYRPDRVVAKIRGVVSRCEDRAVHRAEHGYWDARRRSPLG